MGWEEIKSLFNTSDRITYPSAEDITRITQYSRYAALYDGRHKEVYVTNDGYRYDTSRPYLYLNMLAEITNLIADRLFGEIFEVTTE